MGYFTVDRETLKGTAIIVANHSIDWRSKSDYLFQLMLSFNNRENVILDLRNAPSMDSAGSNVLNAYERIHENLSTTPVLILKPGSRVEQSVEQNSGYSRFDIYHSLENYLE